VGKVILADLSDHEIKEIWDISSIRSLTEHTIVDFGRFMTEIKEIRHRGYALDNEENEIGVCCIAVSLNQYTGIANHAISVSFPKSRITSERIEITANALLDIKSKL
jgi:DNA-binding IclR family transcriptional regulator